MTLLVDLLQAIGLVTPARELHVSDVGDDADDGSEKTPFRTIAHALAALTPGEPIVLRLKGTLRQPAVTVPSGVTLQGPATLVSTTPGPAIRITDVGPARTTDVELRDLVVSGLAPYTGDGGAVLVENADRVTLERCELRQSVAGRGGGLAVLASTAVGVRECTIHDNTAGTPATSLAGTGVLPSLSVPTGNGHGGGIFVRDSDVTITGCDVYENEAIRFGGGIAISNDNRVASVVEVLDCQVTCNQVSHPPLGSLKAPMSIKRADVGDPLYAAYNSLLVAAVGLLIDDPAAQLVALLHGLNCESGLGGGIAIRNATSSTRVAQCRIGITRAGKEGANRARRGGGIACYIGGYPIIEDNVIAHNVAGGDGGGISIDQFDPVLPPGVTTAFGVSAMPMIPRVPVVVSRNEIHHNSALEDGGALYASGAVQVLVKGGRVEANRAAEDGGGLRVTYASSLYAEGVAIRNNQSNVVGSESDGGGGVAARNASVHLQDCELTGNIANGFAGGAVYFVSCWEGGIVDAGIPLVDLPKRVANQRGTFDQIMEGAASFDFHTRVLRIVDCRGSGNAARGASGAGGFLYAVRSPNAAAGGGILGGGEPMWVDIEGARTLIGPNTSEYATATAGSRKRGNVVVELSGTLVGTSFTPQDRLWIGPEIPAGAIAPSLPAMPPDAARALKVMINTSASSDREQLIWAGTGFVFGPVPTVTAVAPPSAATTGGDTLTVTGTGFEDGARVLVGATSVTATFVSATELEVTSPAGVPGMVDVTVFSPSGARATLADALELVAP